MAGDPEQDDDISWLWRHMGIAGNKSFEAFNDSALAFESGDVDAAQAYLRCSDHFRESAEYLLAALEHATDAGVEDPFTEELIGCWVEAAVDAQLSAHAELLVLDAGAA
ncbi:hypothetical protein P6281_06600 [Mycobacterium sp. 5-140-3-2]|uniref:hypothetical protein n=1 Tax=unclassified Mycobacterium TaxID=2642494 RepID=UPI002D766600|nr:MULTISPECIES: hypothetical protein [unclassified Mycobacterium]WRU83588.1 hypothetical protein P6281_06600 [Mycobacterium sp. 5-140-3-2]WSE40266.1 hypothetical protein QGN28_19515 [Mycobacterium sp. 5-140-3-1]